jgi:hypothetical protein
VAGEVDLAEGAEVHLDLGRGRLPRPATVLGFLGPTILLRPLQALADDGDGAVQDAFLVKERHGRMQALRGRVAPVGELLGFRIADGVQGQRRWWSRCAVTLDAVLEDPHGADAVRTRTVDVSAGGVLVEWPVGRTVLETYRVTLSGDELPEAVGTPAVPVRVAGEALALRFVDVPAGTQAVLAQLVIRHLQQRIAA